MEALKRQCCRYKCFHLTKLHSKRISEISALSSVKIFAASQFFPFWISKFLSHTLVTFLYCLFDYVGYFLHQVKKVIYFDTYFYISFENQAFQLRPTLKSCSFPINQPGEIKNSQEPSAGRNFFLAISLSKKIR